MRCSVVVPTYNRRNLLRSTLQSLSDVTFDRDSFEVIVSDDGSSDDTQSVVRSFEHSLNLKYGYMRDDGFRAARARNLGARLADGDLLVFCDAGVVVKPDFLTGHVAAHSAPENRLGIGYIANIYNHLPSEPIPSGVGGDPRERCFQKCEDNLGRLPAPWALAWTANVSMPRSAFHEVGGFDENYKSWGVEDSDLALRLQRAGNLITLVRGAVVYHLDHEPPANKAASNRANKEYLHAKIGSPETLRFIDTTSINLNL